MSTTEMNSADRDVVSALRRAGAAPLRAVTLDGGMALAGWENRKGEAHYERPKHHALSIYTLAGERTSRLVGGRPVSHGFPGAVCLFPAQSQSHWLIEDHFQFLHLYFDDADIQRCVEQVWDRESRYLTLNERYQVADPMLAQAGQLLASTAWDSPTERLAVDHLTQWLLLQVVERHSALRQPVPQVRGGLSNEQTRRIREYIEANLAETLSLQHLAELVHLSPWHFARLFRVSFGQPPHRYLLHRRLERARHLLRSSDAKIMAIALECGFSDQSQFTRAFRQHFGMTPGRYR